MSQQEQAVRALAKEGVEEKKVLPSGGSAAVAVPSGAEDRAKAEKEAATVWEYRYLNLFLVQRTQLVLDWLVTKNDPVTLSSFTAWWSDSIPDANERTAILAALQKHHLIQVDGDLIRVNPKGREYRQWRGPVIARGT